MNQIKSLLCCLCCTTFWGLVCGQSTSKPLRIEKKIEKYSETNSKHGTKVFTKTYFEVVYQDNTREILTQKKLKKLVEGVPEAQLEWQKYKRNNVLKATSLPLLTVGFLSGVKYFNEPENKQRNMIVGLLGIAGGFEMLFHFDKKKRRNENMIIAYCNREWSMYKPESDTKDGLQLDILRIGFLDNNQMGFKMTWYFD